PAVGCGRFRKLNVGSCDWKGLEKNENAGLYTPRSLIRKPKIYTTVNCKGITQKARCEGPARRAATGKAKCRFAPACSGCGRPIQIALPPPLHSRVSLGTTIDLRVEILVVVLALRRELQVLVPGLGVLKDF